MAGYACSAERVPAQATTMLNGCGGMDAVHAQDNPVLCEKHCTPDRPLLTDHAAPVVPSLALAPPVFDVVLSQSGGGVALLATNILVDASDPPPRLRFCSLLI